MGSRNRADLAVNGRAEQSPPEQSDPELGALVREIIGRVADKWTMLVLETLEEHGRTRFTRPDQRCCSQRRTCGEHRPTPQTLTHTHPLAQRQAA